MKSNAARKETENSHHSVKHLAPYQFKKGISGNPGGRGKGVSEYVKKMTGHTQECADTMIKIMRGEKIKGAWGSPSYKDILEATRWLVEQAWGKSPIIIQPGSDSGYDIRRMILLELQKKDEPINVGPTHETSAEDLSGQDLESK